MPALAVTLLVLRCRDLERSKRFYETLGLVFHAEKHGAGPDHYSARVGQTVIELYPHTGETTAGLRFGLRVSDLASALQEAEAQGGAIVRRGLPSEADAALLEDPDGHKLELRQALTRTCRIDASRIVDWDSFHDVFANALGFPGFYGRNMDAWIDCMTSVDSPADGLTSVHVEPGETLTIELDNATEFARRCPAIYEALVDCSAFVNWRRLERGAPPVLMLSFFKDPVLRGSLGA